jgi:hypothetical protein
LTTSRSNGRALALPPGHEAAKLQSQPSMTVKQAARMMNVSERTVYTAKELLATGRDDLIEQVEAGKLKLFRALKLAKPEKYAPASPDPARYLALVKAWNACTDDERALFAAKIVAMMHRERAALAPPATPEA